MKERPILMNGAMVRAVLEGRKTQTRRIVKIPAHAQIEERDDGTPWPWMFNDGAGDENYWFPCPFGQPFDQLWVRETWQYADWTEDGYPWIGYAADDKRELRDVIPNEWEERLSDIWSELSVEENYAIDGRAADRKWRPSIHMPRWASRIDLEITNVRVERLQGISERDAVAEGITPFYCGPTDDVKNPTRWGVENPPLFETPSDAYRHLWESINGLGSWDANPWIWIIEFKAINP